MCIETHVCALKDLVQRLRFHEDETREDQTRREWRHITRRAETTGDALSYDGDTLF